METIRSGNLDKQWHLFSRLAAPLDRTSLQLEMKQSQDTRQYGAKVVTLKIIWILASVAVIWRFVERKFRACKDFLERILITYLVPNRTPARALNVGVEYESTNIPFPSQAQCESDIEMRLGSR